MISDEQMERAEKEFASAAREALGPARSAERALEDHNYPRSPSEWDPAKTAKINQAYADADYMAESRVMITTLIRRDRAGVCKSLFNGCNALLGLLDLLSARDDISPELKEALTIGHRIDEARAAIALARTH